MSRLKFNMMFNCKQIQIRTLKDLRENFFAEDVLTNYNDGTLERWLGARMYNNELQLIRELKASGEDNIRKILETLSKIFNVESNPDELAEDLKIYDYLEICQEFWQYVRTNGLHELEELRRENFNLKNKCKELHEKKKL